MEDEGDYYVNEVDGLPNEHPALPETSGDDLENVESNHDDTLDDLPTSLIVTNIHSEVFHTEELKEEVESLFRGISDNVTFQWLKSFRRLRVNYDNALSAANARIQLHQFKINKSIINCYFAQPVTPISNRNLQPPAPTKQFLISPPSSPPAGWQQADESEPHLINHDLLAALATLAPGEVHELHAPSETQPGILVHTAIVGEESTVPVAEINPEVEEIAEDPGTKHRSGMFHTRCPERT